MSNSILPSFPVFFDNSDERLEGGYIYIGEPNQNPETTPQQAYWDKDLTQTADQPIRTVNGRPALNGSPKNVYVSGDYSITIRDSQSQLVYTVPEVPLVFGDVYTKNVQFNTVSDLLNDENTYSIGSYVQVKSGSFTYKVVASNGDVENSASSPVQFEVLPSADGSFNPSAFGAGLTSDDTNAFNAATRASRSFGSDVSNRTIRSGGGQFNILGRVYLRKGQMMDLGGAYVFMGSTGGITLGFDSSGTEDPGGAPPMIENMWSEGGLVPISSAINGYTVRNVFMSSSAQGPSFGGTDGVISDCVFDDGSTLCEVSGRNMSISNCNFYIGNTQLRLSAVDAVFTGCVFNYPGEASVRWDGPDEVQNVRFVGCSFMKNAQDAGTFQGYVWVRNVTGAPIGNLNFTGCNFRNCYNEAISNQGTGNHEMTFDDCVFDGNKTQSGYNQSTTMYALDMTGGGSKGKTTFTNCSFKNLLQVPFNINSPEGFEVTVLNCSFDNNAGNQSISVNGPSTSVLNLGNISGDNKNILSLSGGVDVKFYGWMKDWLTVSDSGSRYFVEVPFSGATMWDVTLLANQNPGGNGRYRSLKRKTASISYDYTTTFITQLSEQDTFTSTSPLGFNLDLQSDISSIGGGNQIAGVVGPSVVVLHWPNTYSDSVIDVQPVTSQKTPT